MKTQSAARLSNAGDDYHESYVVEKILGFLGQAGKSNLEKITVEGLPFLEENRIDPTGQGFQALDVTEYHGKNVSGEYAQINFVQVKYSTNNSDETWTLGDLCEKKKGTRKESILSKLVAAFLKFNRSLEKFETTKCVKLQLVSNRCLSDDLRTKLEIVSKAVAGCATVEDYKQTARPVFLKNLDLLLDCLKERDCTDEEEWQALQALDFSLSGASSRLEKEHENRKTIINLGTEQTDKVFAEIYQLVRRKLMPENERYNTITKSDVLVRLGINDLDEIFPCKPHLNLRILKPIQRSATEAIVSEILAGNQNKFFIHSDAGCGKSTFVSNIADRLPQNSVAITYDCYGGGDYDEKLGLRHKHKYAFQQIVNELAVALGSPFQISPIQQDDDCLRKFVNNLQIACQNLAEQDKDAFLFLVVDAADNSITGASSHQNSSFVSDLMRIPMPKNARLILTCRTYRLTEFDLSSSDIQAIPLGPFDQSETETLLLMNEILFSSVDVSRFHELSRGIPRIMSYALEAGKFKIQDAIKVLEPNGMDVEQLISLIFYDATKKLRNPENALLIASLMRYLPKPIDKAFLASASELPMGEIQSFLDDLSPFITVDHEKVSFRDEDWSHYVKEHFLSEEVQGIAAKKALAVADANPYATKHLGVFLLEAGLVTDLIDAILNEKYLGSIDDYSCRRRFHFQRAILGIGATIKTNNREVLTKMLFVAGDAQMSDQATLEIIGQNPRLAILHGNARTVETLMGFGEGKHFSRERFLKLLQIALALAGTEDGFLKARHFLDLATSWLEHAIESDDNSWDDSGRKRILNEDFVSALQAQILIYGYEVGMDKLQQWSWKCQAERVLRDAIIQLGWRRQDQALIAKRLAPILKSQDLEIRAVALTCMSREGYLDVDSIKEQFVQICNASIGMSVWSNSHGSMLTELVLDFFELEPSSPAIAELVKRLINVQIGSNLSFQNGTASSYSAFGLLLKAYAIREAFEGTKLTLEEFLGNFILPKSINSKHGDSKNSLKHDVQPYFYILWPVIRWSAFARLGMYNESLVEAELVTAIDQCTRHYYHYGSHHDRYFWERNVAQTLFEGIREFANSRPILDLLIKFRKLGGSEGHPDTKLEVADWILQANGNRDTVFTLINEAHRNLDSAMISSSRKAESLMKCSELMTGINLDYAKELFRRALDVLHDIDNQSIYDLRSISSIGQQIEVGGYAYPVHKSSIVDFAKCVEIFDRKLEDRDHFPMQEALTTITKLHPPSGFSIASRWHDAHIISIEYEFKEVIVQAVAGRFIDPKIGLILALLTTRIVDISSTVERILNIAGEDTDSELLSIAFEIGQKWLSECLEPSYARNVVSFLDTHGIRDSNEVSEFRRWAKRVMEIEAVTEKRFQALPKSIEQVEETDRIRDMERIARAYNDEVLPSFSAALNEVLTSNINGRSYPTIAKFLQILKRETDNRPTKHAMQLNDLLLVDDDGIRLDVDEAILARLCDETWRANPIIKIWVHHNRNQLLNRCPIFVQDFAPIYLRDMDKWVLALDVSRAEIIMHHISCFDSSLEEFSATTFYSFAEELGTTLASDQAQNVFEWWCKRTTSKLDQQKLPYEFDEGFYCMTNSPMKVLASLFQCLFSDSDMAIRWRAIHIARRLSLMNEPDLLSNLVRLHDIRKHSLRLDSPFKLPTLPYYSFSGKTSLLILLEQLVLDNPLLVLPFKAFLMDEFQAIDDGHLLIRMLARRIMQKLQKDVPDGYPLETVSSWNSLGKSKKTRKRQPHEKEIAPTLRFRFDWFDTLPYWYQYVAAGFGLSREQFALEVEHWIERQPSIDLGSDTPEPYKEVKKFESWKLSHSQGDIPRVECFARYLEFHGMYVASNRLLQDWAWKQEYSHDSIEEHFLTYKFNDRSIWPSLRTTPRPLDVSIYNFPKDKKEWLASIEDVEFLLGLGLESDLYPDSLLVGGHHEVLLGGNERKVITESAVVPIADSMRVAFSLSTLLTPYEVYVPQDYDHSELENWTMETEMKGWIRHAEGEISFPFKFDPFLFDADLPSIEPGPAIQKKWNLQYEENQLHEWKKGKTGELAFFREHWSGMNSRQYPTDYSKGSRLWVKRKLLKSHLKAQKVALILTVMVAHDVERGHRSTGDKERMYRHRVFLIEPSGEVLAFGDGETHLIGQL